MNQLGLTVLEIWACLMTSAVVARGLFPGQETPAVVLRSVFCIMLTALLLLLVVILKNQPRGPKGGGEV